MKPGKSRTVRSHRNETSNNEYSKMMLAQYESLIDIIIQKIALSLRSVNLPLRRGITV